MSESKLKLLISRQKEERESKKYRLIDLYIQIWREKESYTGRKIERDRKVRIEIKGEKERQTKRETDRQRQGQSCIVREKEEKSERGYR